MTAAGKLATFLVVALTLPVGPKHGPAQRRFEGSLPWTVLDHGGAIDPTKPGAQVRQTVLATGRNGYVAVLALGEIAPAFENKPVILAERVNGQSPAAGHPRLIVPALGTADAGCTTLSALAQRLTDRHESL